MEPHDEAHLLVVDDDLRLRNLLHRYLIRHRYMVTEAAGADEARAKLQSLTFDLIILDVMMPDETGIEFAKWLRDHGNMTPILMLTALSETGDRIGGLQAGADDYLAKPFEPRELELRLQAILRRVQTPATSPPATETPPLFRLGAFRFDPAKGVLSKAGERVHLTTAETALLALLARRAGLPTSREMLTDATGLTANARAVDVQVTRLRRKIEDDPRQPRYLRTVRGKGYELTPD